MVRFIVSTVCFFAAAALGLVLAAYFLDDMTVSTSGFLIDVVIFAVLQAVLSPFFLRVTARNMPAIVGAVGLISTFVALLVTTLLSDEIVIDGAGTWALATLIIWLVSMFATVILQFLVVRRFIQESTGRTGSPNLPG